MKTKVMEVETSGYCSRIGTIWNKDSKTIDTCQKTPSILTSGIVHEWTTVILKSASYRCDRLYKKNT